MEQRRRKMEILEDFPEDLVEHIISFACDRRGYNSIEYHKRKVLNKYKMKRIVAEIFEWKIKSCSVSWLRPTRHQSKNTKLFKQSLKKGKPSIVYHIGCYLSEDHEIVVVNGGICFK